MNQAGSFGQWVRQRRRALDLTQEELARRVGCAAITIRKIEADALRPSQQIAERLALALGIPAEDRGGFVQLARAAVAEAQIPFDLPPDPAQIGAADLTGHAVRGYVLKQRIGIGGMGVVYRGVQPGMDRDVAIKIILPEYANQPDFIRRFEAEAQIIARLEHPHIVPIYDYWREPGAAYLVMRLLRGGSIQALLENGALPLETVGRLLEQVCLALQVSHRAGVVHRDVKPANVLLDEERNAYLADFGLAKNVGHVLAVAQAHTQGDALLGSPHYMSPEQIRSQAVTPQSDIYCLGVMLYEMLTGAPPFQGPTPFELIQQHITAPLPPLSANASGLPAALDGVIARATAKDPAERFGDALALLHAFRGAVSSPHVPGGEELLSAVEETLEVVNPYKGLAAFGEADAADFFGRETLVQLFLARLSEGGDLSRFLAVIGPSGSGKSSVVRAGLIPALRRGGLPGSEQWYYVDVLPGAHPFEELEAGLLRVAVNPPPSLLSQLCEDERGLLRAVRRILPSDEAVELVLVMDQFEEVFTLVQSEAERDLLLRSLATAILDERSRLRLVITLRADFTHRPLGYIDFGELVQRRSELLLPLTPDELERAIAGPARRAGLRLESGLVATIVRDVSDQPGALPMLQYALLELVGKREGRMLTKAGYRAIGGVAGALGRRAEELFAGLITPGQDLARQIFLRLTNIGDGNEDTRRRVLRSEIEALAEPADLAFSAGAAGAYGNGRHGSSLASTILDRFGSARLLSFDRDQATRGPTVELAHEALLREWARLHGWLDEYRSDVRLQRSLATAAEEWRTYGCDPSFLLGGARLAQFEGWATGVRVFLTTGEREFLTASLAKRERERSDEAERQQRELAAAQALAETERARAAAEARRAEEQQRSASRLRTRNRIITVAAFAGLVLAILAGVFAAQAGRNAAHAETQAAAAVSAGVAAEQQRATAVAAQGTAQAEAAVRSTAQAVAEGNFIRSEAQRLAAEANNLYHAGGNVELIALLSIRSLKTQYTPQGDAALLQAEALAYPTQRFAGHEDWIEDVALSPDGRRLVSASKDQRARIWDVESGKVLATLAGHRGPVHSALFSPDGARVLTGADDGTARLWDAETGAQLRELVGHEKAVYGVAFSPDGQQLLTGAYDKTARLWSAADGRLLRTFAGHEDGVSGVAFAPDGKTVATASIDGTARLWDALEGTELHTLAGHAGQVRSIVFAPDGRQVLTASNDKTARLWDVETGDEKQRFAGHEEVVVKAVFSPDGGSVLTSGSDDDTVRLWDVSTGKELRRFVGHINFVTGVAFSPDGVRFASASYDRTALLWDLRARQQPPVLVGHTDDLHQVVFSPDGRYLLTGAFDHTARLWDVKTGETVHVFGGHTDSVHGVAYSPDGRYVLTGSYDKTARLWSVETGQKVREFLGHTGPVLGVAFSPDSRSILTSSEDPDLTARIWDVATGQQKAVLTGHTGRIHSVAYSPDGRFILTGSYDKTTRRWDASTGKLLDTFDVYEGAVSVVYSPDGNRFLTGSFDTTAREWDASTGRELQRFSGHSQAVKSAAYSPDGRYVVTGSTDGTARLWDAATGQELRRFTGHTAVVNGVAYSPDGSTVATAASDGAARLWAVDYQVAVTQLCKRLVRDLTPEERVQFGITDPAASCAGP